MKPQHKFAITLATLASSGFWGVTHMTGLPKPGQSGIVAPSNDALDFEARRRIERIHEDVRFQCEEIGRRSSRFSPRDGMLVEFLQGSLQGAGFQVEVQEYKAGTDSFKNIIGVKRGSGAGTLVLATHYDSYGKSACANQSATGVTAILETARILRGLETSKTVVVGLFGTGEPPHLGEDTMGAKIWLDQALVGGMQIDQAIIVGSFGSFVPAEGTQNGSFPWYLLDYPKSGDWVGMYAPFTRKKDVADALRVWGSVTDYAARGFAAPTWMPGIPKRDQLPFVAAGIPTVVVSDTGSERDPLIGGNSDDPYHFDYKEMALRVEALAKFVHAMAK